MICQQINKISHVPNKSTAPRYYSASRYIVAPRPDTSIAYCFVRFHRRNRPQETERRNQQTRNKMSPQLIFGTATFGGAPPAFETASSIESLLSTLQTLNITHLDTAARYPPTNPGRSEELIGEVASSVLSENFQIDTKCLVDTATDGSGDLSAESMNASVEKSLASLKRDSVDVLYAHRPDPATPLEQQVRNFHAVIEGGNCQAVSSPLNIYLLSRNLSISSDGNETAFYFNIQPCFSLPCG